jgi:hypothetical protein
VTVFLIAVPIGALAGLSFIGIGVTPPQATWGGMVEAGYSAVYSVPMLVVYPAVSIAITMMAFTFIGDGLRDALDPRTARRLPGRAQTAPVRGQASGLPGCTSGRSSSPRPARGPEPSQLMSQATYMPTSNHQDIIRAAMVTGMDAACDLYAFS